MLDLDDVGAERAEISVAVGPASELVRSSTRMPASGRKAIGCIIATRPSARMREVFSSIVDAVSGSNWSYLIVFAVAMIDAFFPIVPSEATAIAAGVVAGAGGLSVDSASSPRPSGRSPGQHLLCDRPLPRLPRRAAVLCGREVAKAPAMGSADARATRRDADRRRPLHPRGRTATTFTAGFVETYPWRRFLMFDAIAGAIWGSYSVLLGYFCGKTFEDEPWKALLLAFGLALAVTGGSRGAASSARRRAKHA